MAAMVSMVVAPSVMHKATVVMMVMVAAISVMAIYRGWVIRGTVGVAVSRPVTLRPRMGKETYQKPRKAGAEAHHRSLKQTDRGGLRRPHVEGICVLTMSRE